MIALVIEERLPDPAQVRQFLFLDIDAGPDTGMNEQIVAEPNPRLSADEKIQMLGRYKRRKDRRQLGIVHPAERLPIETVTDNRFFPAIRQEERRVGKAGGSQVRSRW